MSNWYVWTINQQRYRKVIEFLENLEEIEDFLYPTVEKEYETKKGRQFKNVPLYNNYVFVKCENTPRLLDKITGCIWINGYVGPCSKEEIKHVKELSGRKYDDLIPRKKVIEGDSYKLIGTPFVGMFCTVVSVDGDKLVVSVELFGSGRLVKCSIDDIYLEG